MKSSKLVFVPIHRRCPEWPCLFHCKTEEALKAHIVEGVHVYSKTLITSEKRASNERI